MFDSRGEAFPKGSEPSRDLNPGFIEIQGPAHLDLKRVNAPAGLTVEMGRVAPA